MLPRVDHRYLVEILRDGAETLTAALAPDWIPAVEWGRFQRVRENAAVTFALPGPAQICPGWSRVAGAPYVSHLEVSFAAQGASRHAIPLRYFAGDVERAVSALVEAGTIRAGETYRWRICAYRFDQSSDSGVAAEPFAVDESELAQPHPVRAMSGLLAHARHHGPRATDDGGPDVTVLLAPHVLREAAEAATAAGTLEAGGILLGKLARDAEDGDLWLEVTAQIPAREAIADDASLRFTAGTWRAVEGAISLRREGEQILGWWHSHPAALWPCRNCPPERRSTCKAGNAFFSAMDVAFHRTAFQCAHNIALLLSFHDDPAPRFDLFGWRRGIVCARGYYIPEEHHGDSQ